jgi:hypothetical protein
VPGCLRVGSGMVRRADAVGMTENGEAGNPTGHESW